MPHPRAGRPGIGRRGPLVRGRGRLGVSLAAVVGVPHDEHGEEIKAFVVLADGQNVSAEDLIAWSKEQMAAYKYPRIVEFRSDLPMNATGKILRRTLRDQG